MHAHSLTHTCARMHTNTSIHTHAHMRMHMVARARSRPLWASSCATTTPWRAACVWTADWWASTTWRGYAPRLGWSARSRCCLRPPSRTTSGARVSAHWWCAAREVRGCGQPGAAAASHHRQAQHLVHTNVFAACEVVSGEREGEGREGGGQVHMTILYAYELVLFGLKYKRARTHVRMETTALSLGSTPCVWHAGMAAQMQAWRRSRRPRAPPTHTTLSWACRRATTPKLGTEACSCRADRQVGTHACASCSCWPVRTMCML